MRDIIERLLRRWSKSSPKETYLKWLEQFESTDNTISTLPMMLVEFWRRVDLKHFEVGPTYRDMMYEQINARHKTITELIRILALSTGAIAQDDDSYIYEISINQFATFESITMDDYFAGIGNGSVTYYDGVTQLKKYMLQHGEVIENMQLGHHCRMLNRMYNDILSVTVSIIKQMKDS